MSNQPQEYVKTTITKITTIPNEPIYIEDQPYYPQNESSSDSTSKQPLYPSLSSQVNYRTHTKSYTTPEYQPSNITVDQVNTKVNNNTGYTASGLPIDRTEPAQVNYRSYNKSYTAPGYQPSHIPVDQIDTNANNNYGYTQNGLPVDRVEFGSMTDDMRYKSTNVGDQFSSAGKNLRGALGRFGHAIGDFGHAIGDFGHGIFSTIDRWSDEVGGNRGAPRKSKAKKNEVAQPSQY